MLDFLPRDVLIDVLTRLPIKTLVRCACVCKSWYNLVTNRSFITTHLNRSSVANNNNNNNLLLIRSRSGDDGNGVNYSLLSCENEMFCDYAELELPLKSDRNPYLRIIGSCNGLVCLSDDLDGYREVLYLWNPSIRKTITLPPLRVTFRSHGAFRHSIGFGFDSLTDDYKVIRIVYLGDGAIGYKTPPEVDIFSLSTGTWRNITHLGLPHFIYERAPQAYLNGAAHWLAYNWRGKSEFFHVIVSFHMGDEVFSEIMVPSSMGDDYLLANVCVAKFQESLSLIAGIWANKTCCVWVMKEYGISDSWTKHFNIDVSVGFNSVVGFTRKGEVLLGLKSGYLVAYDPEAEQVKDLQIRGSTDGWCMNLFYADAYTESLVLFREKFHDTVTCKESPVLQGEASGAKKSRERTAKPKKKGKEHAIAKFGYCCM